MQSTLCHVCLNRKHTIINRSFILNHHDLEDVKLVDFKDDKMESYEVSVSVKLKGYWLTILVNDYNEAKTIEKELRKVIMSKIT